MSQYVIQQKSSTELYHYGVPGMKWGKRKGKSNRSAGAKSKSKKKQSAKAKVSRGKSETNSTLKKIGKTALKSAAVTGLAAAGATVATGMVLSGAAYALLSPWAEVF